MGPTAEQAKFGAVSLQYTAHWAQYRAMTMHNFDLTLGGNDLLLPREQPSEIHTMQL